MNGRAPYIDTSALAKWYLNEPRSEDFGAFITRQETAVISRLTVVEFRCLLARRRRAGDIDLEYEAVVLQAFTEDVRQGVIAVHPVEDHHLVDAEALLGRLQHHPLRTLDAIHLAIAAALKMEVLATADRVMTNAARDLGLNVVTFF